MQEKKKTLIASSSQCMQIPSRPILVYQIGGRPKFVCSCYKLRFENAAVKSI
uniref:Uncharacterized protein n=1 Tax=Nelumbo nucifera TaxID=4432 RepID=A0A822YSB1_NELNU|nr:TPA_asm: hypothetical protein HUJ06_010959 [Nelumbo nucifera]